VARIASVAIAGYYKTPKHLIPYIAGLIDVPYVHDSGYVFVDPCAGDGEAVISCARWLLGDLKDRSVNFDLYASEMEATRFEELKARCQKEIDYGSWSKGIVQGDAFRVVWDNNYNAYYHKGASLLWLNPPYDINRDVGRQEEAFLLRFSSTLMPGGVLVYIIPVTALKKSAATLAQEYTNLHCFRFPSPDYEAYKQIVVLAKKSTSLLEPDMDLQARIEAWAANPEALSILPGSHLGMSNPIEALLTDPEARHVIALSNEKSHAVGFSSWLMTPVDYYGILTKARPWYTTNRAGRLLPTPGVLPDVLAEDLLIRRYPLAMPPRSAHIASGLAAGIFNGFVVHPDDPKMGFPSLLVKGVFDREYRTVDEKHNSDGEKVAEIQVQQPKLVTTVLDLSTYQYVTIKPLPDKTGTRKVSEMTMADLLEYYGRGLMDVMLKQCPVLHNPGLAEDQIALPQLNREMFYAQHQAAQAAVKLLGGVHVKKEQRRGKTVFVLGEIGSGKTTLAIYVALSIGAKRMLVLCPPHLIDGWKEQIQAVAPHARIVVLTSVSDVQALARDKSDDVVISILSRETAKLGHTWGSVENFCPKCGGEVPVGEDLAKQRARCKIVPIIVSDLGKILQDLAIAMVPAFPDASRLRQLLWSRPLRKWTTMLRRREKPADAWEKAAPAIPGIINRLIPFLPSLNVVAAIEYLLIANPDPQLIAEVAERMFAATVAEDTETWGTWANVRERLVSLALLIDDEEDRKKLTATLWGMSPSKEKGASSYYSGPRDYSTRIEAKYASLYKGTDNTYHDTWSDITMTTEGTLLWRKIPTIPEAVVSAVAALMEDKPFKKRMKGEEPDECGEQLFEARPTPMRYPLALYISKRFPRLFDVLALDEGHEYATDGSAQERAAHRLTGLGIPTMLLTGTVMNGYATSLFTNLWALSPAFRAEFSRDELTKFVERYGYRKRIVEDRGEDKKVIEFGSVTDRVDRKERIIGNAPGVLPLLVLKHLLPIAVTLHKSDLGINIPTCSEMVESVEADSELMKRYKHLQDALITQIKADRYSKEGKAGKLLGALSELPSYLDLATSDTGNQEDGSYAIRYPESCGGGLVASVESFPASTILPKEAWMLDTIEEELREGRNVMVFGWHTVILPRLARIIQERIGGVVPILNPDKVSTGKRQSWINREVVAKKARVLVVNPVCVQTGLNNLIYFATSIWMQNPACNPVTKRQADGRIDRVGQDKPTRVRFPVYGGTTQQHTHSLLMHKVAVSMSTDGLDAEAALQAAGIGNDDGFSAFSVGRQIYEMIVSGRELPMIPKAKKSFIPVVKHLPPSIVTEADLFEFAMSLG